MTVFTCDEKLSILKDVSFQEPLTKEFKFFLLMIKIPWIIRRIIIWVKYFLCSSLRKKVPDLLK